MSDYLILMFFLGFAVAIDLLIRWYAYGILESFAIDIAIFSWVYCLVHPLPRLMSGPYDTPEFRAWILLWFAKVLIGLLIIAGLAIWYGNLKKELHDEISDKLEKLHDAMTENEKKDLVEAYQGIMSFAVDLALSPRKVGKKRRRARLYNLMSKSQLDISGVLGDDPFILNANRRILSMVGFFVGAIISIIVLLFPI